MLINIASIFLTYVAGVNNLPWKAASRGTGKHLCGNNVSKQTNSITSPVHCTLFLFFLKGTIVWLYVHRMYPIITVHFDMYNLHGVGVDTKAKQPLWCFIHFSKITCAALPYRKTKTKTALDMSECERVMYTTEGKSNILSVYASIHLSILLSGLGGSIGHSTTQPTSTWTFANVRAGVLLGEQYKHVN